jgi:hypothetical protein
MIYSIQMDGCAASSELVNLTFGCSHLSLCTFQSVSKGVLSQLRQQKSLFRNYLMQDVPLFKSYCCLCFYTSGAFIIDSPTPTLTVNLNEQPIHYDQQKKRGKILI